MVSFLLNTRLTLILAVGISITILSYLLMLLLLGVYVFFLWLVIAAGSWGILPGGDGGAFALLQGDLFNLAARYFADLVSWGLPALTMLITASAAARVARQVETSVRWHGFLVGLVAAVSGLLVNMTLDLNEGGALDLRSLSIFGMTLFAGWLGSVPIQMENAKAEALYRASRAIRQARGLDTIVAAIGENLAGRDVCGVALWQSANGVSQAGQEEMVLLSAWTAAHLQSWPPGLRLTLPEDLYRLGDDPQKDARLLRVHSLEPAERSRWRDLGIRTAVFLPLTGIALDAERERAGVDCIMIAWRADVAMRDDQIRAFLTVDAQVSLMLENLRLVEQARQAGISTERQRLAHEIHDTLAQGFTSIIMHMEAAEQALAQQSPAVHHHVSLARDTARDHLLQARRVVWALRPQPLERAPLPEALQRTVNRWAAESGIPADFIITGEIVTLNPAGEVALLRAAQEALANIRKHAQATQVTVTLSYFDDQLLLDVQDDGRGFDPAEIAKREREPDKGGFGLQTMRERLEQVGGTVSLETTPEEGTTVTFILPLATIDKNHILE